MSYILYHIISYHIILYYIILYITWLHPMHLLIPNGFPNLHRGRVQAQQLSEQSGLSTLHGWWWGAPNWRIQWGYDGDVTGMGYNGILWDVVEWNIMAYAGMYINFLGHKNIMRIMWYNLWYNGLYSFCTSEQGTNLLRRAVKTLTHKWPMHKKWRPAGMKW